VRSLLIFYGWPSCVNGGHPEDFDRYDYVILGAGLEDPKHPDNGNTGRIICDTSATVFGYIDAGWSTSRLTLRYMRRQMRRWDQMGAHGVLLDDFGFGYKMSKRRQQRCVDAAHSFGLSVIVNVWEPVTGMAVNLGPLDFLLCESFYIKVGQYDPAWLDRADRFRQAADLHGCGVMSVTTQGPSRPVRPDLYAEAKKAAEAQGHEAFGWGEWLFSASDSLAPWRGST